jgi:hypothetical protein
MEYYGFEMKDVEDVKMGKGFLEQIRKQEQEVWEQAQAHNSQLQQQQQQQRPQMQNRTYSSTSTMSRPQSNSSNPAMSQSQNIIRYGDDPTLVNAATYVKSYPQQQQQIHHSPYRSQPPMPQQHQQQQGQLQKLQMQQQIPRSTGNGEQMVSNRFHTAAVNRVFNENVLNAYGIKPWEIEAGGKFVGYER